MKKHISKTCSVKLCTRPYMVSGFCSHHYYKQWREQHRGYSTKYVNHWRKVNPEQDKKNRQAFRSRTKYWIKRSKTIRSNPVSLQKLRARQSVQTAIRSGRLKRLPCRKCGNPISEAHHPDYTNPLEVIFLCKPHHREEDKKSQASK